MNITQRAIQLEAFETDPWAAEAILQVEILTTHVIEPSCGTGILVNAARDEGYSVQTLDIFDWSKFLDCEPPDRVGDWLNRFEAIDIIAPEFSVLMNPPFQTAVEFVDRAFELGARKILCFQRFSWRESDERAEWWAKNPPARIWLCIDRASCYRFDIPRRCPNPDLCENGASKKQPMRCRECMSGTTTAHAFFVWERGHRGAETICNLRRP